ncbi:MAG: hypothetical protein J5993_04615 [Clostridia bacterium]|nr:hypothetical protein [Clostridia bacterium]
MSWFNPYGLGVILLLMIPNVIYFAKTHETPLYRNPFLERAENVGRFSCFGFMIFNPPFTWFGFFFESALQVYLIVNGCLLALYLAIWAILFRNNTLFRAVAMSVIPSVLFLFSGIMLLSVPLILGALVFAPCHILISVKNVKR